MGLLRAEKDPFVRVLARLRILGRLPETLAILISLRELRGDTRNGSILSVEYPGLCLR